ncbi:MAG: helix-turn-helix domain-containing protein [Candidatus Aenigmatarchaeota archaeon]|nr:helix-turn-helix domain-containing protein [Candidatus Aenigmarchaeota archaeon]
MVDRAGLARDALAKRIAGEIVLSSDAGKVISKWRNIFKIPQRRLADEMGIMPSVISDYENGRRSSPGIKVVRKMVNAMLVLDERAGGKVIKEFSEWPAKTGLSEAILDLKEFEVPVSVREFCKAVDAAVVARCDLLDNKIHGYTIIDSLKAIIDIPPFELVKLYGLTSERALVFTGAHRGKSSMVALKVTNLKPGLVILHGAEAVDDLAKRIAEIEDIPLAISRIRNLDEMIASLKKTFGG